MVHCNSLGWGYSDNSDIEDIFVKFVKKTRIKLELICIIFGLDVSIEQKKKKIAAHFGFFLLIW